MTNEEALELKRGDMIEVRESKGHMWSSRVVVEVLKSKHRLVSGTLVTVVVVARRIGLTKRGRLKPANTFNPLSIRLSRVQNRTTANVYADWLLENGEPLAAIKLREAFPIDDGKE